MITKLHLTNFRNHKDFEITLTTSHRIVIIYGANGIGKTNILEAISLLSIPNGLRKAKYESMINIQSNLNYWNISADTENGIFSSGYIKNGNIGKRIYKVNDKNVRNSDEFNKDNYILWMTYDTDRLFQESPTARRDFIDMFCQATYNDHIHNVKTYEKLAKERIKILRKYCEFGISENIEKWLDIIETKIADIAIIVAKARYKTAYTLEKLQIRNAEFPEFNSKMIGIVEEIINQDNFLEIYKTELKNRRQKDGISGATTFGINRSDWQVFHIAKKINAEYCSAGEQKMLILAVFFSFIAHYIKFDERNLIILLDDVITHLDANHRKLLFKYIQDFVITNTKVSVWLSGTDIETFETMKETAKFYEIPNYTLSSKI